MSGAAGDLVSCPLKLAGATHDARTAVLQFDIFVDPEVATYVGVRCPQPGGSDPCGGGTAGKLPMGHSFTTSANSEDHVLVMILPFSLDGGGFAPPWALLTEAYFDDTVLVGNADFITLQYTLKKDVEAQEAEVKNVVATDDDSKNLDGSVENGILITTKPGS